VDYNDLQRMSQGSLITPINHDLPVLHSKGVSDLQQYMQNNANVRGNVDGYFKGSAMKQDRFLLLDNWLTQFNPKDWLQTMTGAFRYYTAALAAGLAHPMAGGVELSRFNTDATTQGFYRDPQTQVMYFNKSGMASLFHWGRLVPKWDSKVPDMGLGSLFALYARHNNKHQQADAWFALDSLYSHAVGLPTIPNKQGASALAKEVASVQQWLASASVAASEAASLPADVLKAFTTLLNHLGRDGMNKVFVNSLGEDVSQKKQVIRALKQLHEATLTQQIEQFVNTHKDALPLVANFLTGLKK
jgi:hypothetical protein